MDTAQIETAREELLKDNQNFRELAQRHHNYEQRLTEIAELTYPSDEEMLEESVLKKKKLAVKDEMFNMIQEHTKSH
ncbi:MAG: DUF465 domain-containing protein [Acidobacteria bacterium]|nr:DUF465 domain-containing protein [Acidobacteriota bacterium]MBK8150674.1 DUF465 domain-containing protein [Acidobacteriota bacterium]MBK8811495.1 DUF465 domain-containing protein [Acidobacteriota bacterium]